uniref:Uncharacterized protein n=1 Tax=Parastrongyloides trichosuri TaxID=131310 RepID=A0A0N4ZUA4_PARTI
MEESRASSTSYILSVLSPKFVETIKISAILLLGFILLLGDFLLLLTHSLHSKFLGNDLDYEAIAYYINFGGRHIFYCANLILMIMFLLAICCNSKNISIIYNCFTIIQIIARIIWFIALLLSTTARTILKVQDGPKKENKGLILITIVFSYEIIYYSFSFIYVKYFISHLRRYNPKVGYGFNSSTDIINMNCSHEHPNNRVIISSRDNSFNGRNISWLRSDDFSLKNFEIYNEYDSERNSILSRTPLLNPEKRFDFMPEKSINFPLDTKILYATNSDEKKYNQSDC